MPSCPTVAGRRTARAMRAGAVLALASGGLRAHSTLGAQGVQGTPAIATTLTSTGDTIVARVDGTVPPTRVHHVALERSIAPGADDTTLFTQVNGFQVDRAGRFWVYDTPTSVIFLFSSDGALVKRIGRSGGGPNELRSNNGSVVLRGDRFAVWDAQNARINWYAQDGTFERSTVLSKGFYTFNGLVTDRTGAVYVKHPVSNDRARRLSNLGLIRVQPDGTLGDTLIPPDLNVPSVSWTASRDKGGATATYSSRNAAGASWAWHADGGFVTVDGSRSRVVLSRPAAKPVVVERRLPPLRISREEQADDEAFITYGLRRTVPDWKWTGPAVPDTKPALRAAITTRDGRIWVRVATPSERIPDNEIPARQPNGPPPYRFRSLPEWEIYAADGTFLARVALPHDAQLMEADGNTLWALGRDDDDLPALRRYRIEPPLPRHGTP